MKLYFAGADGCGTKVPMLQAAGVDRILVPFSIAPRNVIAMHETFASPFLDSGAFSAFTRDAQIDLGEYCEFIAERQAIKPWDAYAALDVIGDAGATIENADAMFARGLGPVVAFHYGSDYSILSDMCRNYERIALGGLVPIRQRKTTLRAHLDRCFEVIGWHWPKRVHGFGMQQLWALERYPFHSVDASSWLYGHTRSRMVLRENGRWGHQTRASTRAAAERHARASLSYAVTLPSATDGVTYDATRRNIATLLDIEARLTRLWAARGVTWED